MSERPKLNRRLVLEAPQDTPDGAGGSARSWVVMGELWARLEPGTGREAGAPAGPVARVPYRITVRAAPEGAPSRPRPGQRLRAGARIFAIQAVAEADARGAWLTCFADSEEVAP